MFVDYRIGNKRITATVTKPSASTFLMPVKALIHIPKNYRVISGDILADSSKALFILSFHHDTPICSVFTGIEVNTKVEVKDSSIATNSVTKMSEKRVFSSPRMIYACEQLVTAAEVVGLKTPETIYYLPIKVTTDHFINNVRVRHVSRVSGIYRVEVG